MDGDVAPIAELARARPPPRLPADGRRGARDGALGPGGRGAVAEAGLSGEVDVVVGTLGKTLGSYGAYVCASAEIVELLVNVARPFIFSTAPAAARGRRGARRAGSCSTASRAWSSTCGETPRRCARPLVGQGLDAGPLADPDRPGGRRRRASRAMALCERALEGRRLRPGDPSADRAGGDLAPAPVGDGEPPRRRALRGGAGDRARPPTSWGSPRPARGRRPARAAQSPRRLARNCAASSSPAPAPRSARPSSPPPSPGRSRRSRRAGRGLQARGHAASKSGGETGPRAAAPRLRLGAARRRDRALPLRPARSRRTSARELAGEEIEPARLRQAARAAAADADVLVCEGVGGLLVPLTPRLPGPRPRPGARRCRS